VATHLDSDEPLEIGAILSRARKRQHLDITTVEEQTKIRSKYLRALEDEDWDVLPAPAYARGFIRAYADLLGLDAEVLVDEYRRRHEEPPTTTYELPEPLLRGRRPDDGPRRPTPRLVAGGAILAAILVALLVVGLTSGGDEEDKGRGASKGKRQDHGRHQRESRERQAGSGGSATAGNNGAPTTATVKLVARSDVQACLVDADGNVLVPNQLLTTGTEDGPYVSKSFRVELDPGAAQVMLNGEEARTPPSPEPVAYKVTPEGVRQTAYSGTLCP
jgi:cytoskeleton protein RodZ